jgi:hypothetical protein
MVGLMDLDLVPADNHVPEFTDEQYDEIFDFNGPTETSGLAGSSMIQSTVTTQTSQTSMEPTQTPKAPAQSPKIKRAVSHFEIEKGYENWCMMLYKKKTVLEMDADRYKEDYNDGSGIRIRIPLHYYRLDNGDYKIMQRPVRGYACKHLEVFDFDYFHDLHPNLTPQTRFNCPVNNCSVTMQVQNLAYDPVMLY